MVLGPFWLGKWVYTLPISVLNQVCFFEEIMGVYQRVYHLNSKSVRKKERYGNVKWDYKKSFCCCSDLSNDDLIT